MPYLQGCLDMMCSQKGSFTCIAMWPGKLLSSEPGHNCPLTTSFAVVGRTVMRFCTPFSAALSSDALRAKGSMSKPTCR